METGVSLTCAPCSLGSPPRPFPYNRMVHWCWVKVASSDEPCCGDRAVPTASPVLQPKRDPMGLPSKSARRLF